MHVHTVNIYIYVKTSLQAKFSIASQRCLGAHTCTLMSMYNVNTHKHLCSALFTPVSEGQQR